MYFGGNQFHPVSRNYHWAVIILIFLWVMPGLIGHDPWKADEPYSFGLVSHILTDGDLVVPTLAGEPFMEKPPLFYLTAAGTAKLFSPLLPLHDGARLASGFYLLVALLFTALTAEELLGNGDGWSASLLLAGSLGLQENGHKLITDTALLAGFAVAFYGLTLSRSRWLPGGFWLGTGVGMGFMSKGLIAPGLIGPIALLLPLTCGSWRHKSYVHALLVAAASVLPWLVIWPLTLFQHDPVLFKEWFWTQNIGRFFGHHHLGPKKDRIYYVMTLPWFALPAWPLALFAVWRKKLLSDPGSLLKMPLVAFLAMFSILTIASDARALYAMPMLLPLAILAAAGINEIPADVARWSNRFCLVLFGLAAAALWCGWLVVVTGYPQAAAGKLQGVFAPESGFSVTLFGVALFYTLVWVWVTVRHSASTGMAPIISWTAGVTLVLGIFMTIWLPAIDAHSSYRSVFSELRAALPADPGSVASMRLGESERAMLEYYAGLVTERVETGGGKNCRYLLLQIAKMEPEQNPGPGWQKFWEGSRLGNKKEGFSLWKRVEP